MIIRNAFAGDVDAITLHNCLMAMETESKTLDEAIVKIAVEAAINDPGKGFYLMAEIEGEVAGSLMVTYEWSDWRNKNIWWIQSVFVRESHRRKGVYKALYAKVVELAKAHSVKIIRLYVEHENTKAQATYESLGMQKSNYLLYEAEV